MDRDAPEDNLPVTPPEESSRGGLSIRYGRWVVWLAVALGAIVAGLAYREFALYRPMGSGPAGPPVDRDVFTEVWTEQKVHLFGAGDSITAGLGAKNNSHRSFDRLVRCPDDEFPEMEGACLSAVLPNLTFENAAVSGSNSLDHLAALRTNLREFPAETMGIVLLTTGGNDLIHWYGTTPPREGAMYGATLEQAKPWIAAYEKRLGDMLELIISRFPGGCHIFLADIYDPTDGSGNAPSFYMPAWDDALTIHSQYNRVIHRAAAERPEVHLVPLHQTFLGHGIHCRHFFRASYRREDPTFWYYDNIEDPNDRGHDAVRRVFLNEIIRVLYKRSE